MAPLLSVDSRVIYLRVLATKPLEDREFQFVYLLSLLSNKQYIWKQNDLKLQ